MLSSIDTREKIIINTNECSICCEENECITCIKCSHIACKKCIKQFIISSDTTACFHCSTVVSDELLNVIFEKQYIDVIHDEDDGLTKDKKKDDKKDKELDKESDEKSDEKSDDEYIEAGEDKDEDKEEFGEDKDEDKDEESDEESDEELDEKPKKVVRKIVDNIELMNFRKEKFFNMSKMLFSEDLKYITIREEFIKLDENYKEFINYRYDFMEKFYDRVESSGKDEKFLETVKKWLMVEMSIIYNYYKKVDKNRPYTFMSLNGVLGKLFIKDKKFNTPAEYKDVVDKYFQMNLRFINMVIILDRHINILNKCKRGYNSLCNISEKIKLEDYINCRNIYQENTLDLKIYADDNEIVDNVEDVKKVIIKCPDINCDGFLNNYKCIICLKTTCGKCLSIHDKRFGEEYNDYGCKLIDIETLKLIRSDSKNCPSCGVVIYRTQGCNQMWCTCCHTGFSWKTGKIETNIHNPHYFEWLRETGQESRGVVPTKYRNHYASLNRLYDYIVVYRSNVFERYRYLIGEIDKDKFCTLIYNRYKSNEFNRKFRELIDVTIAEFVIMANSGADDEMVELYKSFNEILEYYENVYNISCKKYRINSEFNIEIVK